MRLVVRHTYDFAADRSRIGSDLVSPEGWDAARETEGAFGLPTQRAAWERRAADPELRRRANDVVSVARELGASSLCSYGVGTALLELNILRAAPGLMLTCTDFAPRTVERLRGLFPESEIVHHDLLQDDPRPSDLHLLHRLDAELPDGDWRRVIARFHEPVLFVPNVLLNVPSALRELTRRIRRRNLTNAGWFRNEAALRSLWNSTHQDRRLTIGGAAAFLLVRR
jgi:hypothetical protein